MPTRILIVEDEAITALDLKHQISSLGYEVVGMADTAEGAVRLAREHHPDLVLMDIRLSGDLDGIVAASAIRGSENIPIIFLTAHSDQATLERALAASPFGYILKPFHVRELRVSIELALYKYARERENQELINELNAALSRVKLLSGLLPICSGCKRIRDGQGDWHEIEEYIANNSDAGFSHGICPICMQQRFPELTQ